MPQENLTKEKNQAKLFANIYSHIKSINEVNKKNKSSLENKPTKIYC